MRESVFLENPITTEIIRNAFSSAANEMCESLFRSAYTPIIYEMKDCAVALFNDKLEALGQSLGVPLFLGNLEETIKLTIDYYGGVDYFQDGDIYILNDAYWTGTHLNDITVFAPIFYHGQLVGFSANRAHWLDVGAKDPGAPMDSTVIYQEGIRLGPLKIMDRGVLCQALVDTICLNSRFPKNARGDLNGQIAACKTGEKRFIALIDRFGLDTIGRASIDIFQQTENMEQEVLAKIPEGEYGAEGFLDNDGVGDEPVRIQVKVTIKEGQMYVDLDGSDKIVKGSTNCGFAQTVSACRMAYKMIIQPQAPVTGGSFKRLHVSAPKGSIFAAEEPAACSWYFSHLGLLIDLIPKALQEAIPDQVAGAHYGDSMVCYFSGLHPETGELYMHDEPTVGGWGGHARGDGQDCLVNASNGDFKNFPVEIFENQFPLLVNRYQIRQDSEGPGRYRGGLGVIREYETLAEETALYLWFERGKMPAWGVRGGKDARPPQITVTGSDGRIKAEFLKVNGYPLGKGWKVAMCTGGGGGYGDPFERDPDQVRKDYLWGYISREHAQSAYGVVIRETGALDEEVTCRLRSRGRGGI
ncbi:hydantoinase B/oxoprolinase family protein [Candidatus Formimonas warabiya]|uniref:5-oxoprolinase n=1 Tax=Formimonas warabiya TaxID=1761012 RepID=A0A3G1L239_FORW1|nr:hydantoinase B/oxoprolinase family protein [Candidatus Formimonas warabiya]ATW28846.1 5-oxoprolinase [Candidatus Formimonas warabiya]